MEILKKKKKKKFEIGIFFSNWDKSHLNPSGKGVEFRVKPVYILILELFHLAFRVSGN